MKNSFFFRWVCLSALFAIVLTSQTMAAEFHVTDATGFQNALDAAETNGQDDTIYLAAGTYGGNFTYLPPGTEHKSLTIIGESGISAEDIILDGQNSGGVFYLFDWSEGNVAELTIQGMSIVNGNKSSEGGGILAVLAAYNITIRNCIIKNNTGKRSGGGIGMLSQWDPPVTLTLENSLILNNSLIEGSDGVSTGGGASLGSYKGTYIIRNNIIAKNSAQGTTDPSGGGIRAGWHYDDVIHLFGNTIYGNQAGKGGGIFLQNGNIANVYNNIIYGNTATEGGDLYFGSVTNTKGFNNDYSNIFIYGTWTSSGENLDTDPLFVDPANDDFHLQPDSPMINAGTSSVPSPPGLPSTDYDGNPRVCGPATDIGAYETPQIYPNEGTIGTVVDITGTEFGSKKGKVSIGTAALKIIKWTPGWIQTSLTKSLDAGVYGVTIVPKGAQSLVLENAFTIMAPVIESVEPTGGSANDEITLRGQFFGTKKGKVRLGEKNCRIKAWTMDPTTGASEIHFVVPRGLSAGTHELKVTNGVGSDTVDFGVD